MAHDFYTIGYEGSTIEDFISTLKKVGVTVLVDVREMPLSRKKGFSKTSLSEILAANHIDYVHLRGLGDPKPGREAARSGDYTTFERIFNKHMTTDVAQRDLQEAINILSCETACLMCFERDCKHCHRHIVGNQIIEQTGFKRHNIGVQQGLAKTYDRRIELPFAFAPA